MNPTFNLQDEINKATGGNKAPASSVASPGAYQYADGGQATMRPTVTTAAAPRTSAPATVAPTAAPEPTIGETLSGIKQKALTIQQQLDSMAAADKKKKVGTPSYETGKSYEELYPEIDEEAIRKRQMRLFQKEIDATNRVYDDMLNQERLAGQGRLGTGRAIAARSGLLGSDFGEAQRSNIVGANRSAERAVQNERSAKIGTIMGTMRKAVADELTEKRAARQQGAENYISWLASSQTRKANNASKAAQAILDAGLDPAEMDEEEINAIIKDTGLTSADVVSSYNQLKTASESAGLETKKTEAEIKKIEADIAKGKLITIGEGTMLYDTETGETFKNPKTYAPGTGGSAGVPDAVSTDIRSRLESNRGADNYTNTGEYLTEYKDYVGAGGDPEEFLKEFDPDIYINPNDPSRSWLESQMKSTKVDPYAALFSGLATGDQSVATEPEQESSSWWSSLTGN